MSTEPTAQAPTAQNPFSTLIGLITNPRETWQNIAAKPGWGIPLLLTMLFSVVSVYFLQDRFLEMMVAGAEAQGVAAGHSDAQLNQTVEFMESFGVYFLWGGLLVMLPLTILIHSALMFFMSNTIFGGQASFRGALSASAWGYAAYALVGVVIALPLMKLMGSDYPLTGLGFLAEGDPQKLNFYGNELELFSFAKVWLTGLGIAAVAKIPESKGIMVTAILFGIWLLYNFATTSLF
jgi:hypothetical protein